MKKQHHNAHRWQHRSWLPFSFFLSFFFYYANALIKRHLENPQILTHPPSPPKSSRTNETYVIIMCHTRTAKFKNFSVDQIVTLEGSGDRPRASPNIEAEVYCLHSISSPCLQLRGLVSWSPLPCREAQGPK